MKPKTKETRYAIYQAGKDIDDTIFTIVDSNGNQLTRYEQALKRLFDFMETKHKLYIAKI